MITRKGSPRHLDRLIAGGASAWALTIGGLALLGYALNIRVLARPVAGAAQLSPAAAGAFIAAGAALWLAAPAPAPTAGRRRAGQMLGLLVALLAAAVLAEYAIGRSAGIDLVLFPGRTRAWALNDLPGRPSPYSAIEFLLIGLSLALLDADARHRHRPARILVAATALAASALLIGYLFDVTEVQHGTPLQPGIALNTAVTFIILTAGILACRPDRLPAYLATERDPGAVQPHWVILIVGASSLLAVLGTAIARAPLANSVGLAATAGAAVLVVLLYLKARHFGTSLDIGGHALSDERDFSQTVLRSMHEGVITIAPDGEVLQANPRFSELTGLSAREVIGLKPPYPWWPPEEVPNRMATLPGTLATSSVLRRDMLIRRADGTEVEVVTTAVPVMRHGKAQMIVGTYSDITERNRAAAAARRPSEQLDHFFDISTDLMCIAGIDGYFKRLNPAWERTLGYTRAELLARPYIEFFHPDDVTRTTAAAAKLAGPDRATLAIDNRIRCRDGSYRWLSWSASSLPENGEIYAVARDTTAQGEADQAKALLAAIVDSTDDPTVGTTLDGTIISWNAAAEHTYGYRAEEAIGQPFNMITGPGGRAEIAGILDRVARGVPIRHHNTVRRRKDGTHLPFEVAVSPIRDAAGVVVGAASVARDITERLNVQRELASARDQALAAAAAKSQFLAMASHEIRTPMNGVIGITALLLDTPLRPAQRRYAEAIRTSGRGLLTIINDILDFSKIEAKKIDLVDVDFDLGTLLESVTQVAAEAGHGKDLDIVGYYPPRLVTAVRGDEGRLRQVLLNLLGNAVKFTDEGEVVLRAIPAASDADGRMRVTFVVTDTGMGIAPEDLGLMLTPFSQADASVSRQFGGTGLGLPIAHQLIELMGGQLDVQSQLAQGSQFSFTIPLAPQLSPPAHAPHPSDSLSGRRLLVVGGNPTGRQLISEHASAWGMIPTSVSEGRVALRRLRDAAERGRAYDVAIIDHHVSGLNGIDLAQRVAATSATKLVLLTSGAYHDDEAAMSAGAAAVLPKPVCTSQLYNCLLNLLDPLAKAASHAQPAAPRFPLEDQGLVLLAEDNEINRMVAADNLSMLGYRVDIAHNGIEAVQLAAAKSYKVIFMDCQMPAMDGYAATSQLREHERPDERVPVIAMTAGAMAGDRERCLAAGMDDYIPKPIDPGQLAAALDRWAGQPPPLGS